jgi:5-bromo-4-chloroindolyl phosphate hydrolysis protein
MAKSSGIAMDKDWQAESDMRTLAEAEEIRKDPKRLKAALAKAKEKIEELQKLQTPAKK